MTPTAIDAANAVSGDGVMDVRSPYDGTVVGAVPVAGPAEVAAACAQAAACFNRTRGLASLRPLWRCCTAWPACSLATRRRWPP